MSPALPSLAMALMQNGFYARNGPNSTAGLSLLDSPQGDCRFIGKHEKCIDSCLISGALAGKSEKIPHTHTHTEEDLLLERITIRCQLNKIK